ncbi:RNA polymerase sigma factor [Haloferula rosea]|uniref:Sigma-70 family RNA polymerase sigma factor n=1 Tax=Haloferula rosea TaxID=490093 RepID=A0A934RCT0_9BACT|nr:sigma-70 family RNA polymerase sigma factor [Haloferula rosea]MBK1827217.1 sigma-70 family RNA polymerase sigma factor [Haloferula rosea]
MKSQQVTEAQRIRLPHPPILAEKKESMPPFEDEFPETRWTLIRRARVESPALEEWCRGYWRPVRAYVRATGHNEEESDEITQEFFHRMLERGADHSLPEALNGAFRAYLKRSIRNFLTDRWRSMNRQRRGGGASHLPLEDELTSDRRAGPDQAFAQAWCLTVMQRASEALAREMEECGKGDFHRLAAPLLDGSHPQGDRKELAKALGMKEGAFRVALHRFRQRFRQLMEEELSQTVSTQDELAEEVRYLLSVWS